MISAGKQGWAYTRIVIDVNFFYPMWSLERIPMITALTKSAIGLFAAGAIALSTGCAAAGDDTPTSAEVGSSAVEESAPSTEPAPAAAASAGLGDTISVAGIEYTLNGVRTLSEDSISGAPGEEIFLVLDVTMVNTNADDFVSSSLLSYELKGSDAFTYDLAIFVDTKGSLDGSVVAGDTLRGEIAFDVPNL
jgi:hypothetical protein